MIFREVGEHSWDETVASVADQEPAEGAVKELRIRRDRVLECEFAMLYPSAMLVLGTVVNEVGKRAIYITSSE